MKSKRLLVFGLFPALVLAACGGAGDGAPPTITLSAAPTAFTYPGTVTLSANVTDTGGIHGVLFYHKGELIGVDSTAPYTATARVGYVNNGTMTFTARAIDVSGNEASASTSISVNIADANEPNSGTDTASTLNIGTPMIGTVGGIDRDEDFFKFNAVAGDKLKLTVLSTSYDPKSTLDPYVTVYRPDGKGVLMQDDDGGNGLESELRMNILETGTYYVRVSSYDVILDPELADNLATNTYQINLTRR